MVGLATRASNEHIKFGDKGNIKRLENNVVMSVKWNRNHTIDTTKDTR